MAKAERPLSVQSRDLRRDAGQRAKRAETGHRPLEGFSYDTSPLYLELTWISKCQPPIPLA
jgi:hypothetical protein